jgi:hypothetical protein
MRQLMVALSVVGALALAGMGIASTASAQTVYNPPGYGSGNPVGYGYGHGY